LRQGPVSLHPGVENAERGLFLRRMNRITQDKIAVHICEAQKAVSFGIEVAGLERP
jgi:hypothetical protein